MKAMGKEIIFYYDVICPYANLAVKLIENIAKRNAAKLHWRPVLLGGIYKQTKPETMELPDDKMLITYSDQKRRVMANDLVVQYNRYNVMFNENVSKMPDIRTLNAMRLIAATPDETGILRKQITHLLFDALWVHQKDVSDLKVLQEIANSVDWDVNVETCLQDNVVKETLITNTKEVVGRGAFGVPSMWVNNRLYFGGDRLFFMEQDLGNKAAEPHRLLSKPLPNVTKAKLTVYFDFSSPWSFLGFKQIPKLLKNISDVDVEVEWVPILLGALFNDIGTPEGPLLSMGENKQRYFFSDLHNWSKYRGVKNFKLSSHFPIRTVLPCRIAIANPNYEMMEQIYDAAWIHDLDISDAGVLQDVLSGSGYNFDELSTAASSDNVKLALRKNTQRALEAGACGVPSFQVNDGPLIFGQDRLNVVEDMIYGWKYDGSEKLYNSKL